MANPDFEMDRLLSPDSDFFGEEDSDGSTPTIREAAPKPAISDPLQTNTTPKKRPLSPQGGSDDAPQASTIATPKRHLASENFSINDSPRAAVVTPSKRPRFFRSPSPPKDAPLSTASCQETVSIGVDPIPTERDTSTCPNDSSHQPSSITVKSSSPPQSKSNQVADLHDPLSPPVREIVPIEPVESPPQTELSSEVPLFLDPWPGECEPQVSSDTEHKGGAQDSNVIDLTCSQDFPCAAIVPSENQNHIESIQPPPVTSSTMGAMSAWEKKYLGGFMCEGYLIYSSARLREGDPVWLSRSRSNGVNAKKQKTTSTKKEDHVVRLENRMSGAFARLNETFAKWIVKLMDYNLIHFEGTLMFPPARPSIGETVHCYLKAYVFRSALVSPTHKMFESLKNIQKSYLPNFSGVTEGSEDRDRMDKQQSINKLFGTIGLVASTISSAEQAKARQTQDSQCKVGRSTTDGIKEDPDADGVIGQENINLVYQKAAMHDTSLNLQSPCDGFELDLRPYQQQGLSWLMKMETNLDEAREETSMHPLWEEYFFPVDEDQANCYTTSVEKFYYNPYMGELSLQFPRASQKCRGGILADEMGLGKTIQMAALICTARPPHHPLVAPPSNKPKRNCEGQDVKPGLNDNHMSASESKKMSDSFRKSGIKLLAKSEPSHFKSHSTLVICPLTLIDQWKDELERCHKALKVFVYHSASKEEISNKQHDVVITTYGIVATEWSTVEAKSGENLRPRGLFKFDWYRIILDEGHNIRNRNALASRACYNLSGERRWIISGTPIVNRLEDLASLLYFIRLEPWGNFGFYRSFVTIPFMKKDPKALIVVQSIIESVLLRREKKMKDLNGNSIVFLPPKQVSITYLELNQKERMVYDLVYSNAKSEYLEYLGQGTVLRNVTAILAILMRLRQAVLHPLLVLKKMKMSNSHMGKNSKIVSNMLKEYQGSTENSFAATQMRELEKKLKGDEEAGEFEEQECVMCLDVMTSRVYLPCMHAFCKDCIMTYIESKAGEPTTCPSCLVPFQEAGIVEFVINQSEKLPVPPSKPVTPGESSSPKDQEEKSELEIEPVINNEPINDEIATKIESDPSSSSKGRYDLVKKGYLKQNDFVSSTKLDALVAHLIEARQTEPGFSAVVFSQFTRFLDLIEQALDRDRFRFVRLDGSLTTANRKKVLATFNEPGKPCILVCSLKVAGVGLNLIKANRVYMMDTWWNEAIENQAIDRIHRFGQEKPTHVVRFLASNTIEERMLAIQKQKKTIINNALTSVTTLGDQKTVQSQTLENFQAIFAD